MEKNMQNKQFKGRADQRVLIFPALNSTETLVGNIYFLLSVTQVRDIIKEIQIYPVPFSPSYTEGIAQWKDHVVPILSLEKRLIGSPEDSYLQGIKQASSRLIMVQNDHGKKKKQGIFRAMAPIRMVLLPIPCTPISSVEWITEKDLVRAIYKWDDGYLVVPNVGRILRSAR
jgi:chemotaxis signal transduction protein